MGKVLVKAGEHVQASEVELSADELKEPLATDSAMSWSKQHTTVRRCGDHNEHSLQHHNAHCTAEALLGSCRGGTSHHQVWRSAQPPEPVRTIPHPRPEPPTHALREWSYSQDAPQGTEETRCLSAT